MVFTRADLSSTFTFSGEWFTRQGKTGNENDTFGIGIKMFQNSKLFASSGTRILNVPQKLNVFNVSNFNTGKVKYNSTLEGFAVSEVDVGSFAPFDTYLIGTTESEGNVIIAVGQQIVQSAEETHNSSIFIFEANCPVNYDSG